MYIHNAVNVHCFEMNKTIIRLSTRIVNQINSVISRDKNFASSPFYTITQDSIICQFPFEWAQQTNSSTSTELF